EGLSDGERMAHLLDEMRTVPRNGRGATFRCVVVLATPGGEVARFEGETRGEVTVGPRGDNGFGYDPVFESSELRKTFAEATMSEKRSVSHRGRALQAFLDWARTPAGKRTMQSIEPRREEISPCRARPPPHGSDLDGHPGAVTEQVHGVGEPYLA